MVGLCKCVCCLHMWQWSSGVLCPLLLPLSLSLYEAWAGVIPAFCTRSLTHAHARIELCIPILPYAPPYLPSSLCIIPSAAESALCLSFQKSKSLVPLCSGPLSASALLILIQSLLSSPLSLGQLPLCCVLYGVSLGHGDADDAWHVDALGPLGEQRVDVPERIGLYTDTRGGGSGGGRRG